MDQTPGSPLPLPTPTLPTQPPPPPSPSADGAVPGWPTDATGSRPERLWILAVLIAAAPLALSVFLAVVAPAFMAPLVDPAVSVLGLPAVVPYAILLVGMVFVAGLLGRYVRSGIIGVVVAAIWMPVGLFLVILGPALVLIAKGLTTGGD